MAVESAAHNDRSTPSRSAAGARAERTMLDVFLWTRLSHLSAGLVSLLIDRRRYRRPRLAIAAFAVVATESIWLTVRCRRTQSYADPVVTTVDTTVGCAALAACAIALRSDDQFGSGNWMFPVTLFSAVGASAGFRRRRESLGAAAAFMTTYTAATRARTSHQWGQSLFGAFQYAGCFVGGDLLIRRHRANAARIEEADREAVARAQRVAQAQERARAGIELHAGALATLRELRDTWTSDRARARTVARREAIRLRRAIRDDDGADAFDLVRQLEDVARDVAGSGMRCELILDEIERRPGHEAVTALTGAVRAALDNASTHGGVTRAVVRVAESDRGIEITVRDQGRGSARRDCPASVAAPLEPVAGAVEWWSEPGRGARVVLRVAT
jgi:signal transduction histidine kinase